MTVIEIKGDIIPDDYQSLYDWLEWQGTSPGKVSSGLALANGGPVDVVINSYGGSVYSGSEIYTMLREHAGDVTVKIVGIAASAASVIAMGGDVVMISPTAQLMIHNASTITEGDSREHAAAAQFLDNVNESIANAYAEKTGLERDEIRSLMDEETFFTAQSAKEKGFVDEIMFATDPQSQNGLSLAASAAAQSIPFAAAQKMKEVIGNVKKDAAAQAKAPKAQPENKKQEPEAQKEAQKPMNKQELKAQHGDVYNEIVEEVRNAERERIAGLNALASHPGSKDLIAAAIKSGATKGEVAIEILEASEKRKEKAGADRETDAKNSGAEQVEVTEPPADKTEQEKEEAETEAAAKRMAESINAKRNRGGVK